MKAFSHLQKIGLLFAFFFVYQLLGSREPPWNDGKQIHQVAEAVVHRHSIDVLVPTAVKRDGKNYGAHPLLPSAVHIPGASIHKAVSRKWPVGDGVTRALCSHLAPAFLGAVVCLLFALLCRDLGVSSRAATLGAITLGLGTMVAVYARSPWSEIVQTAAFLGFFLWLLRVARSASASAAFWTGLWAGLLVNTKLVFVLCLPGALLYALPRIWREHGRGKTFSTLAWAVVGLLPGMAAVLIYNRARTGSFFGTGYALGPTDQAFNENPLVGLWGLFLSPGKSVFLYCPPLIVSALALPWALRSRSKDWFWALLATALPPLFVYSRFAYWSGDWCWGPRYILFMVPVLLVPAVMALDHALGVRRRVALLIFGTVLAVGMSVQVAGASFYWDTFIRISKEARTHWLGRPDRSGAAVKDARAECDPCFEDLYAHDWLPPFNPIEGHFWLLGHVPFDHRWDRAEQDAPWHRYTRLALGISGEYPRARMDWWYLDFKTRFPRPGRLLLCSMLAGLAVAIALWCLGAALTSRARRRHVPSAKDRAPVPSRQPAPS